MKKCLSCEHYMSGVERCQFCDFKEQQFSFEPIKPVESMGHGRVLQDACHRILLSHIDARIEELLLLKEKLENDF